MLLQRRGVGRIGVLATRFAASQWSKATMNISIARCRIAQYPVPDALAIQRAHGPIQQRNPISSCCSRPIEALPELRRRCGTYDLPAVCLIMRTSLSKLIVILLECASSLAFPLGGEFRKE
jgi:hypothetical protein